MRNERNFENLSNSELKSKHTLGNSGPLSSSLSLEEERERDLLLSIVSLFISPLSLSSSLSLSLSSSLHCLSLPRNFLKKYGEFLYSSRKK